MTTHAIATFDIDDGKQEPYDDTDGVQLARARVVKTFHGDIESTSTAELIMADGRVETSRAYVGIERVTGRLHGRAGGFVVQHSASGSVHGQSTSWTIVPDTGAGELTGLRGTAQTIIGPDGGHTFTLDYELD